MQHLKERSTIKMLSIKDVSTSKPQPQISGCVSTSAPFRGETSALRVSADVRITSESQGFLKIALSVCSNLIMAPKWVRSARQDRKVHFDKFSTFHNVVSPTR